MTRSQIGSLCTGYGGLDQAVIDVLGGELAWVADNDPAAAAILTHHHPDIPNHGDITTVDWSRVPPVDIVTAGFPCQPVSNAGLRLGAADERWIWPSVADAVRVLRPRLLYLENVAALVVRGLDAVQTDLAALGYDTAWDCVRASDIGAAHRRERWFCLARPADATRPRLEDRGQGRPARSPAAHAADFGHQRSGIARGRRSRSANGHIATADIHSCGLGADQYDLCAGQPDPDRVAAPDTHGHAVRQQSVAEHGGVGTAVPGLPGVGWGPYRPAIRRWERVLGRPAPRPTEPGRTGERLSPAFVEWLMGLPAGHVTDVPGLSRNAQLKALGNGVVPQQAAHALRLLLNRMEAAA